MTRPRDPQSAAGAWYETGQKLGWENLAEEISGQRGTDIPVRTVRSWADPDKGGPPMWAVDIGDRMLKAERASPYNLIALGMRIGNKSDDPLQRLEEVRYAIEVAARLIEASCEDAWSWPTVARVCNRTISRLLDVVDRCCERQERLERKRAPPPIKPIKLISGED